jgi:hypothetical protein
MFCSHCGFNNKETAKFCENCGKAMTELPIPISKGSSWHKWASIGAALVVICFFLPWMSVSGLGIQIISLTGFEIASGTYSGWGIQAYPATFLLPLIGVLTFAALNLKIGSSIIASFGGEKRETSLISLIGGGLGCVGLLILMSSFGSFGVKNEIGVWGQWAGNLVLLGFGYFYRNG